jgi:hypothetical protein
MDFRIRFIFSGSGDVQNEPAERREEPEELVAVVGVLGPGVEKLPEFGDHRVLLEQDEHEPHPRV